MRLLTTVILLLVLLMPCTAFTQNVDLTVQSIPDSATVKINGVNKGVTPVLLTFKINSLMKIEIVKIGFDPIILDYQVSEEDTLIFDLATGEQVDEVKYLKQLLMGSKQTESQPSADARSEPAVEEATPEPTPELILEPTPVPETPTPLPTVVPTSTPEPAEVPVAEIGTIYMVDELDKKPVIIQPPKIGSIPVNIQNLNVKGNVTFNVVIGVEGNVVASEIVVSSGEKDLDDWILPKLKTAFWEPGELNGEPVACRISLEMNFHTLACRFHFTNIYE